MSEVLLHTKLRELEEELKSEREIRVKYERETANLKLDAADLDAQLEEAIIAKEREIEASKRFKQEIADLKQKIDHQHNENEESAALLKRKQQETLTEISVHLDSLSKTKIKFEKENKQFLHQIEELRNENENLLRAKSNAFSQCRDLESKNADANQRNDELQKQLNDLNELKSKLTSSNSELNRKHGSLEIEVQHLAMNNKRLTQELDDAKMQLENELLVRNNLENKNRNLQLDYENASSHLDEEVEHRLEMQKQINRLNDEIKATKERVEKECEAKLEEIEDSKRRLNNRFMELQDQFSDLHNKHANSEKTRIKLQNQVDSMTPDFEKYKKRSEDLGKQEKALLKENDELKIKLNSANLDLETLYTQNRNSTNELSKLRNLNDQLNEQCEAAQKERRRLLDELDNTSSQLSECQGRMSDLERKVKTIDADRQQLQDELDDSRDLLQLETSRAQNLQGQLEKLKLDTDKKITEQEELCDAQRLANRRQAEAFQSQLEDSESRHKAELSSLKKKYLAEIDELSLRVDSAKKAKVDADANLKKLQQTNKEILDKLSEEQNMYDMARDQLSSAEKRASVYRAELEESKAVLDRVEKAKKTLDLEYHDLEEKYGEAQSALSKAVAERKKFEADAVAASDELHECKFELKNADEKLRAINSALLKREEELRNERDLLAEVEASRKSMDAQLRDAQARIEEADELARREAKRINVKLEAKLAHLENEFEIEKSKEQDYLKELRRLEKRNKELVDQLTDEQNRLLAITDAYDKMQEKMKKYKGQIEGVEEQMAANLSKCKRLQRELEDAEDRAETMAKTFLRAPSVNRGDNYESDYGEENYSIAAPNTQSYPVRSYLYSKTKSMDAEYEAPTVSRPNSANSWRNKYKTLEIDDDDIQITPRYSKYSNFNSSYQAKPRATSTWGNSSSGRGDRARSVTALYDYEGSAPFILAPSKRSNLYSSRSSVSRMYDEPSTNSAYLASSKPNRPQTPKYEIEKRMSLASEKESTPAANDLD